MGAVVEIWFESLIPFLLKDSHIVHWDATKWSTADTRKCGSSDFNMQFGCFNTFCAFFATKLTMGKSFQAHRFF